MALHPDFPDSPHEILLPEIRWFPGQDTVLSLGRETLLPPLVDALRREVRKWRETGYAGANDTSRALLRHWFQTEHVVRDDAGAISRFRYYYAQREAVETIIYLLDVVQFKDKHDLMRFDSSGSVTGSMLPETWRRLLVKMATGSGKTKVMSLVLAWSFFHKTYEPDSKLARNFLIIAPNIIVLDRLFSDFNGQKIFFSDPVLPENGFEGRNWRDDFQVRLHVQDTVNITYPTGNIFLTNIHRVYARDDVPPSADDENTMDHFLGPRPMGATTDSRIDLGMIVRDVEELMIMNDEAHHIRNELLAWFKSIQDIHFKLLQRDKSLSLQVGVTATPRHNNGAIFAQTISDYPLVGAIAQNVIKHPVV